MKVKNIKGTVPLAAGSMIGNVAASILRKDGETDEEYEERAAPLRKRMADFSSLPKGDRDPEILKELQAELDPAQLELYRNVSAELPTDLVEVTVSLGSFLFDLFTLTAPRSVAPLQATLTNRKAEKMAIWCKKDAFEVADDILKQVRPGIENPDLWVRLALTVCAQPEGKEPTYFQVNYHAANFFPQVIDAAVNLFVPPETELEKFAKVSQAQRPKKK